MSIVLLGEIGSGKTTFYNKLTNSNEKTKSGGQSQTRQVFMKQSSQGNGFKVMDTPSFESAYLDHLVSALTIGPLNRIFFLIRFTKTHYIIRNLRQLLLALMKYRVMITVIITYWDQCESDDKLSNKEEIEAALQKFGITSVMYASKDDTGETLCRQIDQIIVNTPPQSINFQEDEFLRNFDLIEKREYYDGYLFELELEKRGLIFNYHQVSDRLIKLINEANIDRVDLSDYFDKIISFGQKYQWDIISQFEYKNEIYQLDEKYKLSVLVIHSDLTLKINEIYDNIIEHTQKKAKQSPNYIAKDCIRKCYYCGEIWSQSKGCTGSTICGISIVQKQINVINRDVSTNYLKTQSDKEITQPKFQNTLDGKAEQIGCGRQIVWEKMIQLNKEELNEIFDENPKYQYLKRTEEEIKKKTQDNQRYYKEQLQSIIRQKIKKDILLQNI